MRESLFRGKRIDSRNCEWVEGFLIVIPVSENENDYQCYIITEIDFRDTVYDVHRYACEVDPKTVGQFTGLRDKNNNKIFEDDIVQYNTYDDFDCHSIVKFGEYKQDGSGGEYSGRDCVGFYVKVNNFTCPDWCEDEPECFPYYMWQQNILEVASKCEIIGNIHDNPELIV